MNFIENLNNLEVLDLISKAMDTKNNEECLNYLEQALEKDPNNNSIKEIIYIIFISLYWKKIEDKNLSETQNLVEKAIEKKILSKININIKFF